MPKQKVKVRLMKPEEQEVLTGWRKLDKEIDEFIFIWTRWKKWEQSLPIVALVGEELVGYHGFDITKTGYTNSVSQFVKEEFRGRRIAGAMIDKLLKISHEKGMKRIRFRCPMEGMGMDCWSGLGARPFAKNSDGKDYWFDLNIEGVDSIEKFIEHAPTLHKPPTTDKRRLSYYRRSDLIPIQSAYKRLLEG